MIPPLKRTGEFVPSTDHGNAARERTRIVAQSAPVLPAQQYRAVNADRLP
jgi:hypothetical protein